MRVERNDREVMLSVSKAVGFASRKGAELIAKDAKRRCPVGDFERSATAWKAREPGTLKKSIKVVKSKFKDGGYVVRAGGYMAYYATWVELGAPDRSAETWKKAGHAFPVPRQPFMRPAKKANEKKINYAFYKELSKQLGN